MDSLYFIILFDLDANFVFSGIMLLIVLETWKSQVGFEIEYNSLVQNVDATSMKHHQLWQNPGDHFPPYVATG